MNAQDSDPSELKGRPVGQRFRGFLPIVVDVETGGFNPVTDALLEIAVIVVGFDDQGQLVPTEEHWYHVQPFAGANIETAALEVNGIDPHHPLRPAVPERDALQRVFREVRRSVRDNSCTRAILVGHNAAFDLAFLNAAVERSGIKRNPFHPFSCFDTATLGGVAYGQTVLSRIATAAGYEWDSDAAHSAIYDARLTADVFCGIVNQFRGIYETQRQGPAAGSDR
jgi:ribonuclease T